MTNPRHVLATVIFCVGIFLGPLGCDGRPDSDKAGTSGSSANSIKRSVSGLDELWAEIPPHLLPTAQVVDDAIKVVEAKRQFLSVMKDREVTFDLPVLVTVTPNERTANWDVEASPLPLIIRRGAVLVDYSVELKARYQEGDGVPMLLGAVVRSTVSDAATAKRLMQSPVGMVRVSGIIREVNLPTSTANRSDWTQFRPRTALSLEVAEVRTPEDFALHFRVPLPITPGPAVEIKSPSTAISVGEAFGASNRSLEDRLRSIQGSVGKKLSMPLLIDGWGTWHTLGTVDPGSAGFLIQYNQPLPYAEVVLNQRSSGGGTSPAPMLWPTVETRRQGLAHLLSVPWVNGMGFSHWQGRAWCWQYNARTQRFNRIPESQIGWPRTLEKDEHILMWLPGDAVEEGLRPFPRIEFTLVAAEIRGPTDQERASGVDKERIVLTVEEVRLSE